MLAVKRKYRQKIHIWCSSGHQWKQPRRKLLELYDSWWLFVYLPIYFYYFPLKRTCPGPEPHQ